MRLNYYIFSLIIFSGCSSSPTSSSGECSNINQAGPGSGSVAMECTCGGTTMIRRGNNQATVIADATKICACSNFPAPQCRPVDAQNVDAQSVNMQQNTPPLNVIQNQQKNLIKELLRNNKQ